MPDALFVYGTLMPGRLRWPHLEPFATEHCTAAVAGVLFDSGNGWPVAVLDGAQSGGAIVPGVLVGIRAERTAECLEVIDEIEDTATDELRRVRVTTTAGELAWAYHYTRPVAGLTPVADWSSVDPALER